jgi:glycerophosphoryl diester phosphodiesterase
MADKRIFDLTEEGFLDDITDKVYMWLDKKANEGETQEPSWKFKADVFLKILNNFATKFVPNVATVEGKCYWHGGELFVCNVAYTGDWVPGNFTMTSVDELFARKDVLSALQDALETTNDNVTALTTYAQNVAHSIAPEYNSTTGAVAGHEYMHEGLAYLCLEDVSGDWDSSKFVRKSELASNSVTILFDGANNAKRTRNVQVRPGERLVIDFDNTEWEWDNVTDGTLFYINNKRTSSALYQVERINTDKRVKHLVVVIPANCYVVEIGFRANTGVKVALDVYHLDDALMTNLINNTVVDKDWFERGNIQMSDSALNYTSSTTRLRTKQDFVIALSKHDVIVTRPGYVMYTASSSDGAAPYTVSGWKTVYTALANEKVHLLVRRETEDTLTFEEAASSFLVISTTSNIASKNYIDVQTVKDFYHWDIGGRNQTLAVERFTPKAGNKLTFSFLPTYWSTNNADPSNSAMAGVRKVLSDNSTVDLAVFKLTFGYVMSPYEILVPDDAIALEVFVRADSGVTVSVDCFLSPDFTSSRTIKSFIKGINHRGYNRVAPENTLPAFRLSKLYGFDYVETDIRTTSDGVLVCLHDETVDRTSNGTGYVNQMTLDQLKLLDFGSWKSSKYAGTKILTFDEFIRCCRSLGLKPYIELKSADVDAVMRIVDKYGMRKDCTIIGSNNAAMRSIPAKYPDVRLGMVVSSYYAHDLTDLVSWKTGFNEVFLNADATMITSEVIEACKAAGVLLETWAVYSEGLDFLRTLSGYISGVTHNSLNASFIVACNEMNSNGVVEPNADTVPSTPEPNGIANLLSSIPSGTSPENKLVNRSEVEQIVRELLGN